MHPLDGPRAKLERTIEQIDKLKDAIDSFVRNHYSVVAEQQGKRTVYLFKAKANIPLMFGVRAGEVLHNMRSALDHIVWSLSGDKGHGGTEFPICDSVKQFESERTARKIESVPEAAKALIEGLQPYRSGNLTAHPLFLLHHLNRFDKHRTLQMAGMALKSKMISINESRKDTITVTAPEIDFPLKNNAVLRVITRAKSRRPMQMNQQFGFIVAFIGPEYAKGQLVIETLLNIRSFVDSAINGFVTFFD